MGRAKDIIVKVIPSKIGNEFIKKHHYSKKSTLSKLYFGCFLDNKLHGVLSFGDPIIKKSLMNLVSNSSWNNFIELNRMAFDDYLPKNSESRCISIAIKLIKKNAPHIDWIISFSDATQCGDGCIYRASGFYLTDIKKNFNLFTNGKEVISVIGFGTSKEIRKRLNHDGKTGHRKFLRQIGYYPSTGYQLRYIYLINKNCDLLCKSIPFSEIDKLDAGMYKGKKITLQERKQAMEVLKVAQAASSSQEGFDSTPSLKGTLQRKNTDAEARECHTA